MSRQGAASRHEDYRGLCAAHALGCLDPDDSARLVSHLEGGCEICRREIAMNSKTVESLGQLPRPTTPPAKAEARLMALAARVEPVEGVRPASRFPTTSAGGRLFRWYLPVAALLITGASLWLAGRQVSALSQEVDRLNRALQQAVDPDVRIFDLAGSEHAPETRARLLFDPVEESWSFHARDLDQLPEGHAYQLWVHTPDGPRDLGTFIPDAAGVASVRSSLQGVTGPITLQVTIEPAPGSPAPTGPVILEHSGSSI
jgi:Anti-sigma-K factor rskA, C-terminal